jgi:uncharacterized membrane protein YbaN (DUF454 family)
MNLTKVIFVLLGTIALGIGVAGIFIPGLPTTPFLLLTAGLYARSSGFLYKKLIESRIIGTYIKNYNTQNGMSVRVKLFSIVLMWLMITVSCLFFIDSDILITILILLGLTGSVVMGLFIPSSRINKN